ncbi:MAG: tRNA epoxyqueuosine(34) reductase QueG [Saprospiraceae bacterium]|nr:tRNA epoxyqueuosine(34) reductase QueG [Saprospiraceae bacterium]|tara:strand:- start:35 stop:967 length:933 start_codon:yes stop_codon:yes gene_type:complete
MTKFSNSELVKKIAVELGFTSIGISKAEYMTEESKRLEQWLNSDHHGKMSYMENHFDKRVDPTLLVEGAKTVISLSYNYYTDSKQTDPTAPKISKYAYGKDYHKVIKRKLKELVFRLQEEIGEFNGRCFVDSAPVMERDWAKRSGLGWIGKHTLLLSKKKGSFFFLAEIISDLELEYDQEVKDHCGSCTACIDACPTDAISQEGYILNANKCISYLTIELKENLPKEFQSKMDDWMFGCDICQDVCPWNRFAHQHNEEQFLPSKNLLEISREEWMDISKEVFDEIFEGSAVKRTKYEGLSRNIKFVTDKR